MERRKIYTENFEGPVLKDRRSSYKMSMGEWRVVVSQVL